MKSSDFVLSFSMILLLLTLPALSQQIGDYARSSDRIIDGVLVDAGDAPWSVSLQHKNNHRCGGTLISPIWNRAETAIIGWNSDDSMPEWMITAAHCLVDKSGNFLKREDLRVFSGARKINSDAGEYQLVQDFELHPDYDDFLIENDIAIVRLSKPTKPFLPRQRASIRLPLLQESVWLSRPGVPYVVAGWGRTDEGGALSNDLLEVTIPRADKLQCEVIFERFGYTVPKGAFCAGFLAGSQDSCQGDSGGAIFYRPPKNPVRFSWTSNPIYIGSVSWGVGCGSTEAFGIYTSVFPYISWTTDFIERHS